MRLAIFGCGSIGARHARNAAALGERDLHLFDTDVSRARALASELSVTASAALTDVWSWKPEAVIIATPSFQHVPLALEAARQGCDLFIEKPLGHSLDGVTELCAEVRARQLVTLVGCNMRFHPGPSAVKRLLDERAIGTVLSARVYTGSYLPSWRPGEDYRASYSASADRGGGAILDCIHEIDLALWYFGRARLAGAVVKPAASIGLEVEGLAELLLEHDSGTVSSVHLNFVQRDYSRGCQVVGAQGTIRWDVDEPRVTVRDGSGTRVISWPDGWAINQMYVDEMRHFFGCVSARTPAMAPLDEGRAALEIALAARVRAGGGPVRA